MTKKFCDICGEPADESTVECQLEFPDKKFSCYKTYSSGAGGCDGVWIPKFSALVDFKTEDLNRNKMNRHTPDLCGQCKLRLVDLLLENLKQKLLPGADKGVKMEFPAENDPFKNKP